MRQKKIPMRKCIGCREMKPKKDLIRVVKSPSTKDENGEIISEGSVSLDLTGRNPGRGAYICRNLDCFKAARKSRQFERAFSCKISDELFDQMEEELSSK